MKYLLLIAALIVFEAPPGIAQSKNKPTDSKVTTELIELERQLSDALLREDAAALDHLWSKDFIFTFPDGTMSDKAQRLALQKPSEKPPEATNLNDKVQVFVYGNTAVVTVLSTWKGRTGKVEFNGQYQSTHVWVKRQGRWQLVAGHVSNVKK